MIFLVESLPCDMDVAGIKHTRFGLLYTLLHQNEIVPFFMDEKRNVSILNTFLHPCKKVF
jgi:hypothetical protein